MLGDGKIDSLDTHLEQFRLNNQANQNELQVVLREYGQLLEDYKALKKAYEGPGVENGPKESSDHSRNPYVLVLIDGNAYIFNDELVKDKEEGGMRAARMLNDNVEKYLRDSLPEAARNHRVVVRIYADLTGLSKSLARSKLVGLEKRSLAPFAAGFTRAMNLFDFVDALDEEGTKFKIREMFKLAAEDSACSHILFAACHDAGYRAQLVNYSGLRDKITLVQGAGFNQEFHQLNLGLTQFPTLFRWSELPSEKPGSKSSATNSSNPTPHKSHKTIKNSQINPRSDSNWNGNIVGADTTLGANEPLSAGGHPFPETNGWESHAEAPKGKSKVECKYFSKGFCRFGNKCNFQHTQSNISTQEQVAHGPERSNVSSFLPTSTVPGFIPLNKDGQRIDTYIKPPTQEEWSIYNARFHRQKPCNSYHLQRGCTIFNCPFDHSDLEPESRHALEYVVKCSPCPRRGACRSSDCSYGHICQKDGCRGQMKGCKMKNDLHSVDPKLASMVPAIEEELVHGALAEDPFETDANWY